ncbi:msr2405 [Mesorhizobium japonicum MAFF 303099]|uniref:Msr2405 protein n=1 Tax=Mesorhizobium japonicum (strain LMG 29417 / CECT 9101 / MAFF 303099) TaxID=266835 RepID=Q98IH2_RHILO|nr:msr2405 [Mesorhizobium japonicum MAFF 303099]
MWETSSLVERFLQSDATMFPDQITRDHVDKMLLAALQQAQSVARSYDTKTVVWAGSVPPAVARLNISKSARVSAWRRSTPPNRRRPETSRATP